VSIKINDDSMYLEIDGIVIATAKERTDGWWEVSNWPRFFDRKSGDHRADRDRAAAARARLRRLSGSGAPRGAARTGRAVAVSALAGQTDEVTAAQMELISTDPRVMHGQAVLAGTRVPVSVILDCLAAGMTTGEIVAEYPVVTEAGIRAAAAYGAALAREELLPLPHAQ
jgi:uncharacterized protein (DUF433 family)